MINFNAFRSQARLDVDNEISQPINELKFKQLLAALLIITLSLLNSTACAQKLRFDHLSVKQGLSQANVVDLMQDKFGFIWIGTEDGLNLYDGYKITVFRNNPKDSTTLSANNITSIAQDVRGNLWIGTGRGLNFYDRETNRFLHFMHDPNDPKSLAGNNVSCVYVDPSRSDGRRGG